ncbi:MAG: hypothetical protein CML61_05845 [Rhodobacteraceae bacterium]|nr:hypothetical protein [Paracoccaceae bacterium]
MKTTLKTLAIAGLLGTVSAPAFAAAHMSASMTCAEYKALSADDQMHVAALAIAETHSDMDGESLKDDARTDTGMGVNEAEATDDEVSTDGSLVEDTARAVEPTNANTDHGDSMDGVTAENIEELMVACDQNLDAMVSEAAAHMVAVTRN